MSPSYLSCWSGKLHLEDGPPQIWTHAWLCAETRDANQSSLHHMVCLFNPNLSYCTLIDKVFILSSRIRSPPSTFTPLTVHVSSEHPAQNGYSKNTTHSWQMPEDNVSWGYSRRALRGKARKKSRHPEMKSWLGHFLAITLGVWVKLYWPLLPQCVYITLNREKALNCLRMENMLVATEITAVGMRSPKLRVLGTLPTPIFYVAMLRPTAMKHSLTPYRSEIWVSDPSPAASQALHKQETGLSSGAGTPSGSPVCSTGVVNNYPNHDTNSLLKFSV